MTALLVSIFTAFTLVIKFVKSILLKYAIFAIVLTFQITIATATIVFVLAFYSLIITSLIHVYNFGHSIPEYIVSHASGLSCFIGVLDLIGFTAAFSNGFTFFFASLTTILMFHLFKFTLFAIRIIANEVFKVVTSLVQAFS